MFILGAFALFPGSFQKAHVFALLPCGVRHEVWELNGKNTKYLYQNDPKELRRQLSKKLRKGRRGLHTLLIEGVDIEKA